MEPSDASMTLTEALSRETDLYCRSQLALALSAVAGRMEPRAAARICGPVAKTLADALGRAAHYPDLYRPGFRRGPSRIRATGARALSALAVRMDANEAARICGQAAKTVAEALGHERDAHARSSLASALVVLAGRMDPTDAARICEGAMRLSVQRVAEEAPAGGPWSDPALAPALLRYLDRPRAKALAREVVMGLGSKRDFNELDWSAILDDASTAEITRRAAFMGMMIGQAASGQFAWAGALAAEPFPCRLTTQELVDLLKMPTCFGKARRVVLDHLGNRYRQRFANHWAFVRYAREQGLKLDFTTAPKRPNPEESVKRMLEILDGPK